MMEWKPIETAPLDEPVLVFVRGLDAMVLAHKSEDDQRWYGYCGETWLNGRISHWHPLPEAPNNQVERAEPLAAKAPSPTPGSASFGD